VPGIDVALGFLLQCCPLGKLRAATGISHGAIARHGVSYAG
jgi:hypothetical protein